MFYFVTFTVTSFNKNVAVVKGTKSLKYYKIVSYALHSDFSLSNTKCSNFILMRAKAHSILKRLGH